MYYRRWNVVTIFTNVQNNLDISTGWGSSLFRIEANKWWVREGSGDPLWYSCLENPMDGGAWWAAVHGVAELDMTEQLHFHFSLSCIGEGNGNPLQCSCLENPRDGGAWWAAIYRVAQSQTRLKQLSSSSSKYNKSIYFRVLLYLKIVTLVVYQGSSVFVKKGGFPK